MKIKFDYIKLDYDTKEEAYINIIGIRGKCEKGHKVGDTFVLKPNKMKICPEIFPAVYSPATMLYYDKKEKGQIVVRTNICAGSEVTLYIKKE